MSRGNKRAKCPKCCPDGGGIFHIEYVDDPDSDKLVPVWQCNNCFYVLGPVRHQKAPAKPNARQMRLIKKIRRIFGGWVKWEMIGTNAYCTFRNYKRKWWEGQLVGGTIGSHGKINLDFYGGSKTVKLTNLIAVDVYLKR